MYTVILQVTVSYSCDAYCQFWGGGTKSPHYEFWGGPVPLSPRSLRPWERPSYNVVKILLDPFYRDKKQAVFFFEMALFHSFI